MTKKNILTVAFILLFTVTIAGCGKNTKKEEPVTPQIEVQNPDEPSMIENGEAWPTTPENFEEEQNPNALDYMAPGHRHARERLKRVQELRQQALDEQQKDLERLNLK